MLVSYNWLQKYFSEPLPKPKDLAGILNTRAYEIEKIEEKGDDFIIDVDVQPNRTHDSLSHIGIAREIATLTGLPFVYSEPEADFGNTSDKNVKVEEKEACPRYSLVQLSNVKVADSPKEIKEILESLGQRSVNNIVDITNLVMLELGQPMHAFDKDKIDGDVVVRKAKSGEKITTLDNKEVELADEIIVIADQVSVLAIAGVKGGKKAEVDTNTKNIVLESANFNQSMVRKSSQKTGIKTDSSKRFENGVSPVLVQKGMKRAIELVRQHISSAEVGAFVEFYENKFTQTKVEVFLDKIQKLLGVDISEKQVEEILNKLNFKYENNSGSFVITASDERLDINIPEDVIEEIGRVYGYENIPEKIIENIEFTPKLNKEYTYNNLIRKILYEEGFSEVMTSSFNDKGEIEVMNPVNKEKPYLRTNLIDSMSDVITQNIRNADLLGVEEVKVFQFGKVFRDGIEGLQLCLVSSKNKLDDIVPKLKENLIEFPCEIKNPLVVNLDELYSKLPDPAEAVVLPPSNLKKYKPFSIYPFILRDIAVWVPDPESSSGRRGGEELLDLIKENAGDLLVQYRLFDEFKKDGRVSYAYRLVFQSFEKTLTDDEVNVIMENINKALVEKGWEVR